MRTLILWADDASPNLGVRALGAGTAALLRRVHPQSEIVFQNYGMRVPQLPIGRLRSLLAERATGRKGMQRWLAGFDLVIDTRSGDSFADIYGIRRLAVMSAVAEFAAQAGVAVVLGPQTIGPFRTATGRALARRSLRRSQLVMARDSESADAAGALGRPVDVLTTDVVFALARPEVQKSRDVVLNVSGLLWHPNPHVDSSRYRGTIHRLLDALAADGREVTLLAHVLESDNPDSDIDAISELLTERKHRLETVVPGGLDNVRRTVASANVVLGSRMHACLNALSTGTPAVPLPYSRKFGPLLADLGWTRSVDLRTAADPVEEVLAQTADPRLTADAGRVLEVAGDRLEGAVAALARGLDRVAT
ncbi:MULTISPECIES: polysaccharide pyruvyl transferase family protein [unclassified Leifsonia]|uniref:polysaccharide pyruvyl transferase family protein n=1 Tax=unclassified Leifsonia TaxID=2663824 RepID=UPI0008A7FE07|nr:MULTISPECIES: polysaccharide pyruvyl transferase family protein [unclassified Leifsonia]SEI02278.1 Polysaccharide pyruvyl transferase family protein WcaK [Leifsonia sp. CL154]SFL70976.1 Polysaccharide pyruvyl transferase family protein WcaK [Leifsonia sp. CL147]